MSVTFVLVRAASPHVIDYSEVGGRDGVGAATAVTVAAAQAAPWGSLCVDAAGAAAALGRDGRGCTVPIWDILWLPEKKTKKNPPHTHTRMNEVRKTGGLIPDQHMSDDSQQSPPPFPWSLGWWCARSPDSGPPRCCGIEEPMTWKWGWESEWFWA